MVGWSQAACIPPVPEALGGRAVLLLHGPLKAWLKALGPGDSFAQLVTAGPDLTTRAHASGICQGVARQCQRGPKATFEVGWCHGCGGHRNVCGVCGTVGKYPIMLLPSPSQLLGRWSEQVCSVYRGRGGYSAHPSQQQKLHLTEIWGHGTTAPALSISGVRGKQCTVPGTSAKISSVVGKIKSSPNQPQQHLYSELQVWILSL